MKKRIYSTTELFCDNQQKTYNGDAAEAAFLLGGIGTGNVSVGARGELRSWEIFNEPGHLNYLPYTFFAIRTETAEEAPVAKVLESRLNPPFAKSEGFFRSELAGLTRFEKSTLSSRYPFVQVKFEDREIPVQVRMEAFTPFIPLDTDNSSIPGAYIRYHVRNPLNKPVRVSIAGSLANAVGFEKYNVYHHMKLAGDNVNEYRDSGDVRGLYYTARNMPEGHISDGSMSLVTTHDEITVKPLWLQGEWTDGAEDFWADFASDGKLETESEKASDGCELAQLYDFSYLHFSDCIGSLCLAHTLEPEEEKVFEFVLTWHFPNRVRNWINVDKDLKDVAERNYEIVQNYYAGFYQNAWDVGQYLVREKARLEGGSRDFATAFYDSSLPGYVLEAVANNITVLRSPTCFRIEGGHFLGWEGVRNAVGCGAGNCTHVWNYAQTAAFLFPELEQSMRRIEFVMETDDAGYMPFRTYRPLGLPQWKMSPSADGQLGAIVRLYREWKLGGSEEILKACWDKAALVMDVSMATWDKDGDDVPEQPQHVTYDTELYGVTSMVGSLYYAALKAAAEMAACMGDQPRADKYRHAFENGSKRMDELSWNGEYYSQVIDDVDRYRYQYGEGCLSDQLLGQFMAHAAGLGYILPEDHVKTAVLSIYRYNFIEEARTYPHAQRAYTLNDEKGLTPCTWPRGGKPRFPFIYYGEVWTGIEHEVAALLFYEGFIEEGLTIVKALRDRHDGYRRNPWSENESGYYYARSLASWALLPALSGFACDPAKQAVSFHPKINRDDFNVFWCNGTAWGTYAQKKNAQTGQMEVQLRTLFGDSPVLNP